MDKLRTMASSYSAPTKRPVKYANGQVHADETAYEPYLHAGSDYDSPPQTVNYTPGRTRVAGRKSGLRKFCIFCSVVSLALSLGVLGVSAEVIVTLGQTATARLLWDHGLMMKAWPLTGAPAVPTYVTVSAASATALLNAVLLFAVVCGRDGVYSSSVASAFAMATHVLLTGWFAAALVTNGLYQPNLRSWACENGSIEQSYKSNIVGLGKVCTDMFAVLIASLVIGAFELFNALTVIFVLISERRMVRARANFPKSSQYKKLAPTTEEPDEVQLLEVSRKQMA